MAASKSSVPLWLLAAAGGIFYFSRMVTAAANLEYDITGLRLKGVNITNTELEGDLAIFNPTNTTLIFSDIFLTARYNGSPIGEVKIAKRVTLAPKDTTIFQFPLRLRNGAIISQLISIISSRKFVGIQLAGSVVVNSVRYPIDQIVGVS